MASLRPARTPNAGPGVPPAGALAPAASGGGRARVSTVFVVATVLGLGATAVLCLLLTPDLEEWQLAARPRPPVAYPFGWIAVAWVIAPLAAWWSLRPARESLAGVSRSELVRGHTASVVRTRRAVVAAATSTFLSVLVLSFGFDDSRAAALPALALLCCIPLTVVALVRIDDLDARRQDSWLRERRRRRDAERGVERRVGVPRFVRAAAGEPRASEVLHQRYRWSRRIDRVLYVWLLVGFHVSLALFGPAGMFAYPGAALLLLVAQDRVELRRSRGLRPPISAAARERARERMRRSRTWWSANPPRTLQRMRVAFALLVALGFVFAILVPALRGDDPAARYRATIPFVTGFLLGLVVLGLSENEQARRERAWLARRRDERRRERSPSGRPGPLVRPLPR